MHRLRLAEIPLDPAYHADWEKWQSAANADHREACNRSYSMANGPREQGSPLVLNVRIQPPPENSLPAGRGSSYIFNLKAGDRVKVSGPFGNFRVKESRREMVFIGGGAGMAPLRSMIVDQLQSHNTDRRISFWYGARSLREVFYRELFDRLQTEHDNFTWHLGLSEPLPEDNWQGPRGFISDIALKNYLCGHCELGNCEFYLCGPPAMRKATISMLTALGVDRGMIAFDDFGS